VSERTPDMRFDDQVVIVTGAGRGLGRAYALAFARRGAAVIVNDTGTEPAADGTTISVASLVVEEIVAAGGRAVADIHSVADAGDAESIVAAALVAFGKVTVLVNNAGVIDYAPLPRIGDAAWARMVNVTLGGAFFMTRAVWPQFEAQGFGRVVNTTSNAGFAGNADLVHYGAAKLGVAGFTKALAQECGEADITVNAVAPMAITRMNRDAFFGGAEAGGVDWQADIRSGLVPMGPPEAVTPTVLWLAHASTRVNGQIYSTSSGRVARVAFIVSEGWFKPDHQPEDLRDHHEEIRDLGAFIELRDTAEELALIPRLFSQKLN